MKSYGVTEAWPTGQKVENWVLGSSAMRALAFCWNFDFDAISVPVAKAIQNF